MQNKAWVLDPDFITKTAEQWPDNSYHLEGLNGADPEIKKGSVIVNLITLVGKEKGDTIERLME